MDRGEVYRYTPTTLTIGTPYQVKIKVPLLMVAMEGYGTNHYGSFNLVCEGEGKDVVSGTSLLPEELIPK